MAYDAPQNTLSTKNENLSGYNKNSSVKKYKKHRNLLKSN